MKRIALIPIALFVWQCSALGIRPKTGGLVLETTGEQIKTSDLKESVILISFQSVTCSFCKEFNRDLVDLKKRYPKLPVVIAYPEADFRAMMPPDLKDVDAQNLAVVLKEWTKLEPSFEQLPNLKSIAIGLTDNRTFRQWQANNTPTFVILRNQKRFARIEGYERSKLLADIDSAIKASLVSPSSH